MKVYELKVTFTFKGTVTIKARDLQEAKQIAHEDFGNTLGTLDTTNDEAVIDWSFDVHADKKISK